MIDYPRAALDGPTCAMIYLVLKAIQHLARKHQ
jgi:hypothetical protein